MFSRLSLYGFYSRIITGSIVFQYSIVFSYLIFMFPAFKHTIYLDLRFTSECRQRIEFRRVYH